MKTQRIFLLLAFAGAVGGCATAPPKELLKAREDYQRAAKGPAMQLAPVQLHAADLALAKAEKSFKEAPDSYKTKDLAYVAQRKAELAEATASIAVEEKAQATAAEDYDETQGKITAQAKEDLSATKAALATSERSEDAAVQKLRVEEDARVAADKRASEAQAALVKLAAVRDEPRGLVITLSGSVLFASNQATLLTEARSRIDQVVAVLLTTRERRLTIEGHTDSQGSDDHNIELSQRRAEAVKSALIERGYEGDLIQARGLGETRPIADNGNPEGRANNRRVEIIVDREERAPLR